MRPILALQSTTTPILESLLVHLVTHLEGIPLSTPGIPPTPSVVLPSLLEFDYGFSLVLSMVSLSVPVSFYSIPLNSSVVPLSMPVS